jgi:HlyD family secretion protein
MKRFKRVLRWWPLPVAVLVLAGVSFGVLRLRSRASQQTNLEQVYTVERGTIVATVTTTGEVYAPRRADLAFDVTRIPLIELLAVPGRQVKAGDVLARIDPTTLQRTVTQAEADLLVAKDNLEKVKNPYTALDLAKAKLAVSQAEIALAEANKNLETVQSPDLDTARVAVRDAATALQSAKNSLISTQNDANNTSRLRTLEYELRWYEVNYWEAQEKFKRGEIDQFKLDWEYSNKLAAEEKLRVAQVQAQNNLANAQNTVTKAQEAYNKAVSNLATLEQGPAATDLAKAQNQVAQAEINLQKAREDLATIEAGPKARDVDVAQARVDSAQAALEAAQAALAAAVMKAPFDGTIVSTGATVGDLVSSNTVVVTIADLTTLRVRATVDETDITKVQVGQDVNITFDAIQGARFRGKVLEVPLQGRLTQNILTYEVPVSLEAAGTAQADVKPGMTANVSMVAGRRQNVLLVPVTAILQANEGSVVKVQGASKEAPVVTPVTLGLSDGLFVEVVQGLQEGDAVVVSYQVAATQQQQQQQFQQIQMPGQMQINPGAVPGRQGR